MSEGDSRRLRVMAWNVGFGSRKGFPQDSVRANGILKIAKELDVDIVALQEMGNAEYAVGLPSFHFVEYLKRSDFLLNSVHFLPTISLGSRHCYPYGKIRQINDSSGVCWLEYGPGIWVRNVNAWYQRNLWSDKNIDRATVEVQRPMPHPLYMGLSPAPAGHEADKKYSAGRDEEDRPVLWSRIDKLHSELKELRFFFLSLHLPTLKGEEQGKKVKSLNETQKSIANITLSLSEQDLQECLKDKKKYCKNSNIVDVLASKLRVRYLEQVFAQCKYIEGYWKSQSDESDCVFIFAGDFNFQHSFQQLNKGQLIMMPEEKFLHNNGFLPAKKSGFTRSGRRLVDNIWVRGPVKATEHTMDSRQTEEVPAYKELLGEISDHFPVVADIGF